MRCPLLTERAIADDAALATESERVEAVGRLSAQLQTALLDPPESTFDETEWMNGLARWEELGCTRRATAERTEPMGARALCVWPKDSELDVCAFVVECQARLLISERAAFARAQGGKRADMLLERPQDGFSDRIKSGHISEGSLTLKGVREALSEANELWHDGDPGIELWATALLDAARMVCMRMDKQAMDGRVDGTTIDLGLIRELARFFGVHAGRVALATHVRTHVERVEPRDGHEERVAAVRAWADAQLAVRRTATHRSLVNEFVLAWCADETRLGDPCLSDEPPPDEFAAVATKAIGVGFDNGAEAERARIMEDGRAHDARVVYQFAHTVNDTCGLDIMHASVAHERRWAQARTRLDAMRRSHMAAPPPLLMWSAGHFWCVTKSEGAELQATVHDDAVAAVASWIDWCAQHAVRGCVGARDVTGLFALCRSARATRVPTMQDALRETDAADVM